MKKNTARGRSFAGTLCGKLFGRLAAPFAALALGLALLLSASGCSVRTFAEMHKDDTGGLVTVQVAFAPFFVDYLRDLMGFEAFSDVIDLRKIREFFQSKQSVLQVSASVSNDPETLTVAVETNNIEKLFAELNIPYETENGKIRARITKDFVKDIVADLPAFQKIGTDALFIFDGSGAVSKEQFPEYLGWALSDYAPRADIEQTIRSEKITIEMKKNRAGATLPDEGWTQKDAATQQLDMPLPDVLYEDAYNLRFSY